MLYIYIHICGGGEARVNFFKEKKKVMYHLVLSQFLSVLLFFPWGQHVICRSDALAPETLVLLLRICSPGNTPDLCH